MESLTCFTTTFPRVLGGTQSTTTFQSIDKDPAGNIVVGGSTSDSTLANLNNSPDPILLFVQHGNSYLWGINFRGTNFDGVGGVKFTNKGSYIYAGLTRLSYSKEFTISVLQSLDGKLIRTLRTANNFFKFHRIGQMLIDATDRLFVGFQEFTGSYYYWYFQKFSPIGTRPTQSPYQNVIKLSDRNPESGAHTLVFTTDKAGILVSGSFTTTSLTTWTIGFAYIDEKVGNIQYIYGAQTTDMAKRVTNLDISSSSTAWGCGDFNLLDLLIFTVPISSNVVPTSSAVITGIWNSQSIQCLGITAYSTVDSYIIASNPISSNDVRLIKAQKIGSAIQISSYSFENTFSGSSTNLILGAFFQQGQSKFYLVGTTKYLGGNLARAFSNNLGFIMEADYLLLGAQNQCLQLTLTYSTPLVLPSATILSWSSANIPNGNLRTSLSLSQDTGTSTRALKSLNLNDQSTWCGPQTIVTFTVSPFTSQTYNVGVASQVASIVFSDFALAEVCTDALYTYSAQMSTGAALPSFLIFDPTLRSFDWLAASASDAGTYNIDVMGTLSNGQSKVWMFTLIVNSCATAVISTSPINSLSYYQNGSPFTLNLTPFTSSVSTSSCGPITYTIEGPVGSGSLQSQYFFNSASMTLVITCNLCQKDGTVQTIKLTATQTSVSNSIQFSITFLSQCTSASVIAPLQQSILGIKVSNPILTLPINFFLTSVQGCQVNLFYSCPECSSSQIFSFTSPNIMIQALTNDEVGVHQIEVYAYFSLPETIFQTIIVTVDPDCTQVTPSGDSITNFTYELSEGVKRIISTPVWDTGFSSCNSLINFLLIDLDTGQAVDSSIIKLDRSPIQISVLPSTNATKARQYQLNLQGSIGSQMTNVIFSIMITNICPSAMPIPEIILDQKYILGDPTLTIQFPQWKDSLGSNNCGAITYSANSDGKSLDTSWIKFDQVARKFSVQTSNILKIGTHSIKVFAKLVSSGRLQITQFQLTLIDPCATASIIPSTMSSGLTYQATASTVHPEIQYSFTKWKDDKAGKCEPIIYQIGGLQDSNMTGTFSVDIKPLEGLIVLKLNGMIENPTTLQLLITGALGNGKSTTIQVPIKISPDPILKELVSSIFKIDPSLINKNKTVKADLKMRLKSISTKGVIVIQFSKPLMQISNLSIVEDRKALNFMILGSGSPSQARIINWKIQEWGNNYIKIQLMIQDAEKISLGENQDQLKVVIREPQFFRSNDAGSVILVNSLAQIKFPPQQTNTTFAKTFDQVSEGTKSVLSGSLGVNFIICLIFGASMSNMWQLLNIVQIITMLPMLRIPYSSMFITTTDILRTLAQFDILPVWLSFKYFRENILGVSSFDDFAKFNPIVQSNQNSSSARVLQAINQSSSIIPVDDTGPKISSIGIDSTSIIMNLGPLGDMVIGMMLLSLGIQVLRLFFECFSIFQIIYDFFAEILFFNSYIQASNQSYLFFSIVTLHSMSNLGTNDKTFDKILTILMFVYIIIYPLFTLIYLIIVQPKIEVDEKIRMNSGSFFDLVHQNHGRGPILNIFVFLLRRIVLALTFFFLSDNQQAQVAILMLTSFYILIYQCHFKPFISKQDSFFEFYNEATLLGISYCLFASLQFESRQTYLDYAILCLILCAVVANFLNFLYSSYRDLRFTCKKLGFKFKRFWKELTQPKLCCCQSHNSPNSNCPKKSHHRPTKTVKIEPQIDFSESEKEETKGRLFQLNDLMTQVKTEKDQDKQDFLDLDILENKKTIRNINQDIQIETNEEENKYYHGEENTQQSERPPEFTQEDFSLKQKERQDQNVPQQNSQQILIVNEGERKKFTSKYYQRKLITSSIGSAEQNQIAFQENQKR